jgi:hypothetical protein
VSDGAARSAARKTAGLLLAGLVALACPGEPPAPRLRASRLGDGPLIAPGAPGLPPEMDNLDGPSAIHAPPWVASPPGAYCLYFASHHGDGIWLAAADRPTGPWRVYRRPVLRLEQTSARGHIASPDVHVDETRRQVRMYFHGPLRGGRGRQATFVATSADGLAFHAEPLPVAPPYLRAFAHAGCEYGIARPPSGEAGAVIVRSCGGAAFTVGPSLLPEMRHGALLRRGQRLWIVYSRIGDAPERLLLSALTLRGDWRSWRAAPPVELLRPERPWEGADLALEASTAGAARGPRHELRDPALLADGGRVILFYSVAGERGIAAAELLPQK